jgi:pimeloyl-ACP methyl ester carboxylesterase
LIDTFVLDPTALEALPDHVLAPFGGARPPAPDWYEALRRERPETLRTEVDGAGIEVLAWGEVGRPGILLVHGNRAHAHWWGPVAPLLGRDFRVASLSLSGMGGSDWRERYTSADHAAELFAAIAVARLDAAGPPIVTAHSFGAIPAAAAAKRRGEALGGVVFVDSFIVPPGLRQKGRLPERTARDYPDLATALARFRLTPSQPTVAPYILDDVARAGVVQGDDGRWRWRFDPQLMRKIEMEEPWDVVQHPPCRIGFVYGERSPLATPAIVAAQRAGAPAGTPSIGIPEASHHIMFDQPSALVAVLRSFAANWFAAVG